MGLHMFLIWFEHPTILLMHRHLLALFNHVINYQHVIYDLACAPPGVHKRVRK
jgi:hypothetical protein